MAGEKLKNIKNVLFITIIIGQSSMQFFPSLLFKNDWILKNDGSFPS